MFYTAKRKIKALINNSLDVVFPPQCISCKTTVESHGSLCNKCWESIEFISSPQCNICGTPFEFQANDNSICGQCISSPPQYTQAKAVFRYDEKSSRIITNFKYYDNTQNSKYFAKWLARTGEEIISNSDIITSVPLHSLRLLSRRYNQSALLSNHLGRLTSKDVNNELIIRHKNTKPQAGLTFNKRMNNVKSAFKINPAFKGDISDKNILLIDDVMTTGSTINACTKTLLHAGAKNVFVLTLAITVRD